MHNYISRNGVTEQTFYYRQQPRHLQHLPWDFEIDAHNRRAAIADGVVLWLAVLGLIVLIVRGMLP